MLYRPPPEEGQGLMEYALILVLIAVVVVAVLVAFGPFLFRQDADRMSAVSYLAGKAEAGDSASNDQDVKGLLHCQNVGKSSSTGKLS